MTRYVLALLLSLVLVLGGCATNTPKPSLSENWRATLVTATGSPMPGDIRGVRDRFSYDGRIHAHLTLVAKQPSSVVPADTDFTFKWFNGSTLVHERSGNHSITKSPYYIVHAVPGAVLGTGKCRVEVYSDNELLSAREITVSER